MEGVVNILKIEIVKKEKKIWRGLEWARPGLGQAWPTWQA